MFCLSLPCELWLGLLSRVWQQGRVQRLQELLSDVQSASGHVKTNSGGTLLTVLATLGVGAGAAEEMWGYDCKMELTGQGPYVGTGWTIQGVSKSA